MNKCVVFGITSFAGMLTEYLKKYTDYEISAYVIDSEYKTLDNIDGIPVVEFEKVEQLYSPKEYKMFLALGYRKMNETRKKKYLEAKKKGYMIGEFIHPSVTTDFAEIGEGNLIFENVTLAYGVKIGNANIIWNGCQISHETVIGDYNFLSAGSVLAGKVSVENNCFLGVNSAVKGGNILKNYTFIGAGCYLNESSEEYGAYVPSKAICLKHIKSINLL